MLKIGDILIWDKDPDEAVIFKLRYHRENGDWAVNTINDFSSLKRKPGDVITLLKIGIEDCRYLTEAEKLLYV